MRKVIVGLAAVPLLSMVGVTSAHADAGISYSDPDTGLTATSTIPDANDPTPVLVPGDNDDEGDVFAPVNFNWCGFNKNDANYCLFTVYPDWEAITGSMWISSVHDSGWHTFGGGAFPWQPGVWEFQYKAQSKRRNYSYYWQGTMFTDTYLDNAICTRGVFHSVIGAVYHTPMACEFTSQWIGDNPDTI